MFYHYPGMNSRTMAWSMMVAVSAALTLQAHPGHAPFSEGTKHFIASPFHLGVVLALCAALAAAAQLLKGRAQRNLVRAVAVLIAAAAVLL